MTDQGAWRRGLVVACLLAALGPLTGPASAAGDPTLTRARSICLVADEEIATIPRPANKSARAQADYVARGLDIVARSLHAVRALHWSAPVRHALATEAQGLALQRQEVAAIRRGDGALERQLGDRAARVTHPADVVLRRAGLGACVGA